MLTVASHTKQEVLDFKFEYLIVTRWALLQLLTVKKLLQTNQRQCLKPFECLASPSQIHVATNPIIFYRWPHQNYTFNGCTVNGSGIGPASKSTKFKHTPETRVDHETNPNEVPIPQIIVQTGDTPQNLTTALVTELPFNRWSPLASDLHALATLFGIEYERFASHCILLAQCFSALK